MASGDITILLMHFFNLPRVLSTLDDIVVEFIPETQPSKLGSRKLCQRAQIETPDCETNEIYNENTNYLNCNWGSHGCVSTEGVHCELESRWAGYGQMAKTKPFNMSRDHGSRVG